VIVMVMGEKDGSDVSYIKSCFRNPTRSPIASVDNVEGTIDDQQV